MIAHYRKSPKEILPGDVVTFWQDGVGYTTREVVQCVPGHLQMKKEDWCPEAKPLLVALGDVYSAFHLEEEPAPPEEKKEPPLEAPDPLPSDDEKEASEVAPEAPKEEALPSDEGEAPVVPQEPPQEAPRKRKGRRKPQRSKAPPAFDILDLIPAPGNGKPKG